MITNLIPASFCERAYIAELLGYLRDLTDYHIIATHNHQSLPEYGQQVVALVTSGESYKIPGYLACVRAVWACYVKHETEQLRALPLGPVWDVPVLPLRAPRQRGVDVFFAGQIPRRPYMQHVASTLARAGISADIVLTESFRTGLRPTEYARRLMNARIALCPQGVAPETFRHYEAARSGCALISIPLPAHSLYEGSPIRQVAQFDGHLVPVIRDLLENIEREHERVLEWWTEVGCARAAANRIRTTLGYTSID